MGNSWLFSAHGGEPSVTKAGVTTLTAQAEKREDREFLGTQAGREDFMAIRNGRRALPPRGSSATISVGMG